MLSKSEPSFKSLFASILKLHIFLFFSACTIYQSPERRTFESESPTFKIQSLQKIICRSESVKLQAHQSRLITFNETASLWEHMIHQKSFFESADHFKKEYCLYEIKN